MEIIPQAQQDGQSVDGSRSYAHDVAADCSAEGLRARYISDLRFRDVVQTLVMLRRDPRWREYEAEKITEPGYLPDAVYLRRMEVLRKLRNGPIIATDAEMTEAFYAELYNEDGIVDHLITRIYEVFDAKPLPPLKVKPDAFALPAWATRRSRRRQSKGVRRG